MRRAGLRRLLLRGRLLRGNLLRGVLLLVRVRRDADLKNVFKIRLHRLICHEKRAKCQSFKRRRDKYRRVLHDTLHTTNHGQIRRIELTHSIRRRIELNWKTESVLRFTLIFSVFSRLNDPLILIRTWKENQNQKTVLISTYWKCKNQKVARAALRRGRGSRFVWTMSVYFSVTCFAHTQK